MITIKTNIDSFQSDFETRVDSISLNEILEKIGFYQENEIKKRFDTSSDAEGKSWKALKYRKGNPLRDTAALMGSFNTTISGSSVKVWTDKIYANIHDQGGVIESKVIEPKNKQALCFTINGTKYFSKRVVMPRVVIPQRKFSGISSKNKEDIEKLIKDYMTKKLNK